MSLSIVGVDEAGRGPLAGPVVAGAVRIIGSGKDLRGGALGIKDSKKITAKKREILYDMIINHPEVEWGVGVVSKEIIDDINILEATKLAMKISLEKIDYSEAVVIIDGNFKINIEGEQKSVIGGDATILECSMASIVAKVERDRIMKSYHLQYPEYDFATHKGYGTKKHREMIKKYGPSPIHRKSFKLL